MRQLHADILTLLDEPDISIFYMVEIGEDILYTSARFDIDYDGKTFLSGTGILHSVQPPRLSSTVDREAYSVSFTDIDFSLRPYFEAGLVGETMKVYIGFYNFTDSTLGGFAPGEAMIDSDYIVTSYEGKVDTASYNISYDGEVKANIEGTSPMGSLGRVNGFYTSKQQIRGKLSTDTSFDQIYEGSEGLTLLWGKGA